MRVKVKSVLDTSIEKAWSLLQKPSTLVFVAEPIIRYETTDYLPEKWEVGFSTNLRPQIFTLAATDHTMEVVLLDRESYTIVTDEQGGNIRVWQHTMRLVKISETQCLYVDEISINAGVATPAVWLFAEFFYRHRHRRWRLLLKQQ